MLDDKRRHSEQTETGLQPADVDVMKLVDRALFDALFERDNLGHAVARQDAVAVVLAAMTAMGLVLGALGAVLQRFGPRHVLRGVHGSRAALIQEIDRLQPQLTDPWPRDVLARVRFCLTLAEDRAPSTDA